MDFFKIRKRKIQRGSGLEIYPDFTIRKSEDLLIRGGAFYAIWDEAAGLWSRSEFDAQRLVDKELWDYYDSYKEHAADGEIVNVSAMMSFGSGSWTKFKQFVSSMPDSEIQLDSTLAFVDTPPNKKAYSSRRLNYSLKAGDYSAWDELVGTLYDDTEREKIEWCIGSIVSGDSVDIQKFAVFYGEAGAGKSTILNVIQKLFDGYYVVFDAKALTSNNNQFATEVFRSNPLVAIQHDGDLSRIEDNTTLNSIVSHEYILINQKFKSQVMDKANCFLFMATNRPVKITDAKSGIIRRLIDIKPSGKKIPADRYYMLMSQINFQLGAIAEHCLEVYRKGGKNRYDSYRPKQMIEQTDAFYNFVGEYIDQLMAEDGVSLQQAYEWYKTFCDESKLERRARYKFREELKNYFETFEDEARVDGKHVRNYYSGFKVDKFLSKTKPEEDEKILPCPMVLDSDVSLLDDVLADCPAQYAVGEGGAKPNYAWDEVRTTLKDLDTKRTHFVLFPEKFLNLIVIDFDIRDEKGQKNMELNLKEASKWPPTYAEFSKGGNGVHLHYWYDGDPLKLKAEYAPGIEIKVYHGKASLRRRVTKCNDIPIARLSGGLPEKEVKSTVNDKVVKTEQGLRNLVERNLRKEFLPGTKPSMDFIKKILDDAYEQGLEYDLTDMRPRLQKFAIGSTNHKDYCMKMLSQLKLCSENMGDPDQNYINDKLVFFDVEVFPNLLLVCWKYDGENTVHRMFNPTPSELDFLFQLKLVGFNCRRYDNHIIYGAYLGESNAEIYDRSRRIIAGDSAAMFGNAYNLSYTDVFDFSSKKQSLKKFEIEYGEHHQEFGHRWDEPLDEEYWEECAQYCENDVRATERTFKERKADWMARQTLAAVAKMTPNDTTNSLTTRIIFGGERKPQSQFNYRNMGDESKIVKRIDEYTCFDKDGKPIFPGYRFDSGKSIYRGEEVGEGGYVYAETGIYTNVALLDIASMHPSSIVAENLFGDVYTSRFKEILQARIFAKHGELDSARKLLGGQLAPYLTDVESAAALAQALKIAINSVYGLTSAKFDNPFRDLRNKDNIVAKRGALFMVNLKHEVQQRGFTVAHIKTDSIKIPNATPEIIQFVMDYGKMYGYTFEHEATYDRMCLVNDAVYIAKYKGGKHDGEWTATGAEFQHPYVFKRLFSKEPIEFRDLCEVKTVTSAMYLDFNEDLDEGEHQYRFVGKTGLFTPVIDGVGGGVLYREKDGKYYAVGGTKGYRWLEAEMVEELGLEDKVDFSYFDTLAKDARDHISEFGDYSLFVEEDDEYVPCGDQKYLTCWSCPKHDPNSGCTIGYNDKER